MGISTDLLYGVDGALEDWAYAAAWENEFNSEEPINICDPDNSYQDFETNHDDEKSMRVPMILIETSDNKEPEQSELGTR